MAVAAAEEILRKYAAIAAAKISSEQLFYLQTFQSGPKLTPKAPWFLMSNNQKKFLNLFSHNIENILSQFITPSHIPTNVQTSSSVQSEYVKDVH